MMGACVSNMSVMPGGDAGMETDGEDAGPVEPDAGPIDGGRIPMRRGDDGCGCAAAGVPSETPVAPMALGALGLGLVMARRRRR
jgi:MYXO-CTERM domain-containing protein